MTLKILYLSRIQLRRDASVKALLPLLTGNRNGQKSQHPGHHLVWSLFADSSGQQRDFLWREMERGEFLILSARIPVNRHNLFRMDEPKLFAPALSVGDRLHFSLQANPVVRRRDASSSRSAKHDVVMDALRFHATRERVDHRYPAIQKQGFAWLERQAEKAGFKVRSDDVWIDGYRQHHIVRKGVAAPMCFSTLNFDGELEVRDPPVFLSNIARGFGAAKAYGCGLMLIRRIR